MFKEYIDNFHEGIEGLRDFVELINPFLSEHRKKMFEQHKEDLLPLQIARLRHLEEDEERKKEYTQELQQIFDGEILVESKNVEGEDDSKQSVLELKVQGDTSRIDEAIDKLSKTEHQKELLYKNSLISLLSTTEWFFFQILHYHYDRYPDSAGIKKKTLTLEELKSFGNLKDAENYLIDDKIEGILRGSFQDWLEALKNELSLKLGYITQFESELIEVYQRRNLLVHNGGTVNSIYLSKVDKRYKENLNLGTRVSVSEEYLERAISLFHTIFTMVACELWKKNEPEEEERCKIVMNLGYEYLKKKMWDISQVASVFLIQDKKMPIASRTAAQLNYWLSKKSSACFDEVRKEVEDADFSDKSGVFQVALHALRDEKEEFFHKLPQVVRTEELQPNELMEYPIFATMRADSEFQKFIETNDRMKNYLSDSTSPQ